MCVQMYHGYAGVESLIKVYTSLFADATVCARVVLPSCTPPAVSDNFVISASLCSFLLVTFLLVLGYICLLLDWIPDIVDFTSSSPRFYFIV